MMRSIAAATAESATNSEAGMELGVRVGVPESEDGIEDDIEASPAELLDEVWAAKGWSSAARAGDGENGGGSGCFWSVPSADS